MTLLMVPGRAAAMMCLLVIANGITWAWAWHAFSGHPALLGTALLAWVFGFRHAVDADHIAAIDNVVRKLVQSGRRAWDSGLFFAIGHSATVMILCLGIVAFPSLSGVERMRDASGVWGTLFSAGFLFLIGTANLSTLRNLWRARDGGSLAGAHGGSLDAGHGGSLDAVHGGSLDAVRGGSLDAGHGGLMSRVLRPVQRLVGRPWHMVPVGFLFGLGFDTASEVALLVLTAQHAAAGLAAADVLVFPAIFAAGMALVDAADSTVMTSAYLWALREPARKLNYNIAVTALSIFVAIGVSGVELLGMLAGHEESLIGRWPVIAAMLDVFSAYAGFVVAALLLSLWGCAVLRRRSRSRLAG